MNVCSRQSLLIVMILMLYLPASMPVMAQESVGLSAGLHQGTCAEIGTVVFDRSGDGAETTNEGSPVPAQEPIGAPGTLPILQSATTLDASLSDLVEAPLALVVSKSGPRTTQPIACGEIGGMLTSQMVGMVMPGDELAVALRPINGSDYAGIALVTAAGATATIHVYLAEGLGSATP